MIPQKLTEVLFSHLWVVIAMVIVLPFVALVALAPSSEYASTSTVWVDRTITGTGVTFGQDNQYLTPAQNQAQTLNDLLKTRAFRLAVAARASLIPPGYEETTKVPEMEVLASTVGANLVTVTAQAPSPSLSAALVRSVIAEYQARVTAETSRQLSSTIDFYEAQLPTATAELQSRQQKLSEYLQAHPNAQVLNSPENTSLEYQTLLSNVDAQQKIVDSINDSISATNLSLVTVDQNQGKAFEVQDDALEPSQPLSVSLTKRVGLPMVGLAFGVLIAVAYVTLLFRTDHTIRTTADVLDANVPVLGMVSELRPTGLLSRLNPDQIFHRRKVLEFARRVAASIPMTEDS